MLDLVKLAKKLDKALAKETPESLRKWLDKKKAEERNAENGNGKRA